MTFTSKSKSTSSSNQSGNSNKSSIGNYEKRSINEGTKLVSQPSYAKPPRKFEAGTCNLGAEAGLVEAIRYVESIGLDKIREHETALSELAIRNLNALGGIDIYPSVSGKERSLISFNIRGVHPHDAATIMDSYGVCVRAGHHCAEPLMERLGIGSCLRASFAIYNDIEDVDVFIRSVEQTRKVMGIGS